MSLHQKTALITGAGSGVGRAVAHAMMQAGYAVVLLGRRKDPLAETAALCPDAQSLQLVADVSDPDSVRAAFGHLVKTYGRLDVLFNNAGVGAPAIAMDELTFAQWKNVVDINLTGAFLCAQEAMRLMKTQTPMGGRIINNGSVSATAPRPNSAPYTATKHAMTGLTKSISLDGRPFNIACGQIDIGNAATEMAMKMKDGVMQANGTIAPEPLIDPKLVADAILYMAGLPLEANVQFMTVMATKMPLVGRG